MKLTFNGTFREVISVGSQDTVRMGIVWSIDWDPNKAIDIGEWSICGGGQLRSVKEVLLYIYIYIYIYDYWFIYIVYNTTV